MVGVVAGGLMVWLESEAEGTVMPMGIARSEGEISVDLRSKGEGRRPFTRWCTGCTCAEDGWRRTAGTFVWLRPNVGLVGACIMRALAASACCVVSVVDLAIAGRIGSLFSSCALRLPFLLFNAFTSLSFTKPCSCVLDSYG